MNHQAVPRLRLPLDMRLRYERHIRLSHLTNPERPCAPDPSLWDESVTQEDARALCRGCPIQTDCGTVAIIDEAIVLADKGGTDTRIRNSVVSGTRGGMSDRARRPIVAKLADRIITGRMERAEQARAEADRKRATAEAAKAGAAA
ncbi:WhiB family transcriptional regulator [Nonomuraea basaltis]|uniref:WhiB family transcriptional regulator n=1 Tax=Nonomuraea basaltis TaxID=2495887 RepID=UPI0014872D5B|nr:WhiB family transcriptional regulator [Nonomuraea basaltis]